MARSLARRHADSAIENSSRTRGEHKSFQRHYAFASGGDDYVFRRYQTNDAS